MRLTATIPTFLACVLLAGSLSEVLVADDGDAGAEPIHAADVPCEEWVFQGYRLEMSTAEARSLRPSKGLKPSSSLSTSSKKTLRSKFTVGSKREGWSGTVTIKNDELVKLKLHYKELTLDELVDDLVTLFGEPLVEGDQRHFKSHRCNTIVVAEEHPKQGSRITLQSIGDHVVEKYKKGGS